MASNATTAHNATHSSTTPHPAIASALVANPVDDPLDLFLVQLVLIIFLTRVVSKLLNRLKQPSVIAEIIAGILLGPSVLGYIPGFTNHLFPPTSITLLGVVANMGLILFMFFLGLEVDVPSMAATWKKSVPIAILGLIFPWITGGILSLWLHNVEATTANSTVFFLFVGCAFSFTAMPVLGRILAARKLIHTELGITALSIAAVDDLLAWLTLALVLAYANGGGLTGFYTILVTAAFVVFLIFGVRKLNLWLLERLRRKGKEESRTYIAFILLSLCASAFFADIIGIHALFGAFVYGMMVPRGHLLEFLAPKVELLVVECFLPLYFAKSGLSTKFGSFTTGDWGIAIVVLFFATVSKIVPVTLGTFLLSGCKAPWRHALSVGFLMNTRGLISLIVLGIGMSSGILHIKVFTMLVFTALVTTFMTSPVLYFLQKPQDEGENRQAEEENQLDIAQEEENDGRALSLRRTSTRLQPAVVTFEKEDDRRLTSPLRQMPARPNPSAQVSTTMRPGEEKSEVEHSNVGQ